MRHRQAFLDKYFINITLEKEYPDIYYVRKSILKAVEDNTSKFTGTLLDVGCGIMPYRELVCSRNTKITRYIGLDFESSLDSEYAMGKPDLFWKGDVIPLGSEAVDTVFATELFEHCAEPEKIMKEIIRVLKPGGLLFLTVPFLWNLHLVPFDEYRYTPYSLTRHLTNAGFINIELQALGGMDASLAQMLGIWFHHRNMTKNLKSALGILLLPFMKKLIEKDKKVDKKLLFHEGSMITGISGIAYKR